MDLAPTPHWGTRTKAVAFWGQTKRFEPFVCSQSRVDPPHSRTRSKELRWVHGSPWGSQASHAIVTQL